MTQAHNRIIIRSVCELYHISPKQLKAKTKARDTTEPRGVAIFLLHNAGMSWNQLKAKFYLAHGPTRRAYRRIADRYEVEKDFREKVSVIEQYLAAVKKNPFVSLPRD